MSQRRLLIFLCGALAILIIAGAILGSLLRLLNEIKYSLSYFLPYWLVNPILFIAFILFSILFVQIIWPWLKDFIRKYTKNKNASIKQSFPESRYKAAKQSLGSIDQLIDRLQDDVSKEGLKQERERVAKELERGDLIVVIFGTGSSGKTSLIRALLNEIVGDVKASMGSTSTSNVYRLKLKGLKRSIQLIDTPGILESGRDGWEREKEAKFQAARSDLILVVVDSDLRSTELRVIRGLITLGKRVLLVLNKCDLRGEEEERRLISKLKTHCKSLVEPENILPASASPQSIPKPGGKPWQPPPELEKLLSRLAKVLYLDGEELLADNILMQCRNLGESGRQLLTNQRRISAGKCVDRYAWISSGVVAANPLPGIDLLGTAAINTQMVMEIAKIYGVQLTKDRAQELVISLGRTLAGLGIVKGGVGIISTALTVNLPTLLIGRAIQSIAAAWLTKIAGASYITYFAQDQDWGDGGIQEIVQHHYELNKRNSSLKKFLEIAVQRVVEPLQKKHHRQLPPRPEPREGGGA